MSDDGKGGTVVVTPNRDGSNTSQSTGSLVFTPAKYHCPRHGTVETVIESNIPGYEGRWCQKCWVESLDKSCHRVTDAPAPKLEKKW